MDFCDQIIGIVLGFDSRLSPTFSVMVITGALSVEDTKEISNIGVYSPRLVDKVLILTVLQTKSTAIERNG